MGTNYYARCNICERCKRYDELHIGKSSMGWTFGFHATEKIRSWQSWREFLDSKSIKIVDEYGREVSFLDFEDIIISKRKEKHNHAREYSEGSFLDEEGHSFTEGEFS